jgi:hypothetical protein
MIGDSVREVIPFIALESKKWKTVNPNFVTLELLPIRAIYDQLYLLHRDSTKLNALLEDCVPYDK